MSVTDILALNTSELFAKVRIGLPVSPKTQNLLECKDDLLFTWDANDGYLLVTNWRTTLVDFVAKGSFQTLIPSTALNFDVERVSASNECSLVALSGPRGVAILELPRRWGPDGFFMDGKPKITCRTFILDGLLFSNNPHLEVRQLRWHSESTTDSHLLVLLTNNTMRLYNNSKLRHVWQIGPSTIKSSINTSLSDLGETAVDFDIAPAVQCRCADVVSNNELNWNQTPKKTDRPVKIEWPIVILRENGNIYILLASIDSEKTRLQGPITIKPQTNNNYGVDSCALMIIPSLPPTVVIAESNGKLHHALLLESETAEHSFNEVDSDVLIDPSEWNLQVLETVELELGLPKKTDSTYSSPIHLKRDFINELRYFAYHNAGLHVISVNFIAELQRFLDSNNEDDLPELSTPSRAEYILCTKLNDIDCNPVLGVALLQMPAGVVMLLGSGQVISLKMVIDAKLLTTSATPALSSAQNAQVEQSDLQCGGSSFGDTIRALLQRSVNQPILSANKQTTPSPQERYELLNQSIEVLRTQYLKRHELVRAEFAKRINRIRLQKEQQLQDIQSLEKEREIISEQAHKLAERFEEISDNQELLTRKCHKLMQSAKDVLPGNVIADREFANEVANINKATKTMSAKLSSVKKTMNKQRYLIAKTQQEVKGKTYVLPEKQHSTVTEILTQLTIEIDRQITDMKRINSIVGV